MKLTSSYFSFITKVKERVLILAAFLEKITCCAWFFGPGLIAFSTENLSHLPLVNNNLVNNNLA